jgi:hypothetical protein
VAQPEQGAMRPNPSLYRQIRTYFAELRRLRKEEVPYVTRCIVSRRPVPKPPQTSDFPGLIFILYADPNGEIEVTAYWRSREAATANASVFKEAVGAESILSEGYLRHLAVPEQPWWKRVPVGRWILYISSFLGALAVLQTYFAKTFEPPKIHPEISGPRVLNALASQKFSFDLAVTNRSRYVETEITIDNPVLTRDGRSIPHRFDGDYYPLPVVPTTTKVIPFVGDPLKVGSYTSSALACTPRQAYCLKKTLFIQSPKD